MRKKSHIGLARFLVLQKNYQLLMTHRFCFYIGSILPDCRPSFLTTRHNIESTLPLIEAYINKLLENQNQNYNCNLNRRDSITIGQLFHYIADYFTYPHNSIYPGNIADHCKYEEDLKLKLREFFKSGEALNVSYTDSDKRLSTSDIIRLIIKKHDEYISLPNHTVEEDCRYIIGVNQSVLCALS